MNVDNIIKYESGEMGLGEMVQFFADMIKSGDVWSLQGHYGRNAMAIIEAGIVDREGNIDEDMLNYYLDEDE
jgi:hypothetical protein